MPDIARGVRSFTLGTAASRVLGLVREMVFAWLFGASGSKDVFVAAFRIPNLLRDLFAENALSSAFVPVLVRQKEKGPEAVNRFASNILNVLLFVVGLIVLAGIPLSPALARLVAPGFGALPGKLALTGQLTAIMFPFLLFIALAAWAMSVLNTEGSFFVPSIAPAFWNVFSILVPLATFAYFRSRGVDPILGAAIGVTFGGLDPVRDPAPRRAPPRLPLPALFELQGPRVPEGHGPLHPRGRGFVGIADQRLRQHDARDLSPGRLSVLARLRLPDHAPAARPVRDGGDGRVPSVVLPARRRGPSRGSRPGPGRFPEDGPLPDRPDLGPDRGPGHAGDGRALPARRPVHGGRYRRDRGRLGPVHARRSVHLGPAERRRGLLRLPGRPGPAHRQPCRRRAQHHPQSRPDGTARAAGLSSFGLHRRGRQRPDPLPLAAEEDRADRSPAFGPLLFPAPSRLTRRRRGRLGGVPGLGRGRRRPRSSRSWPRRPAAAWPAWRLSSSSPGSSV